MLWMTAVVLVFLWLLAFMGSYRMGGFIHVLPAIAALAMLIGMNRGRRKAGTANYNQPD
ncbi:lmo0937 family membrane protein [Desulfoprunum benzoelyticum]|uniref:Lmo0937 family membrane protein n=1 Tax=Desulfoprunum benzoelyticum TaxID=1506996 RepID=A0A840UTA1_9BACT|nr:lmo0937 family membrane protein [Desulfoprunum benzoelyticum]MBB5349022.1 hypothetical protein [Desulfoprunum benzoelyticum]MBM9530515.1 lmo0937 family membrane protein [Desulfoprunum benzoelyticum]